MNCSKETIHPVVELERGVTYASITIHSIYTGQVLDETWENVKVVSVGHSGETYKVKVPKSYGSAHGNAKEFSWRWFTRKNVIAATR